jgi:hypothetical protein
MTENELGRALLKLDAAGLSGVPDLKQQTWKVLDRDRRSVRRLAGLTILLWLLSAALILTVLVAFGLLMPRQAKLRMDVEQGKVTPAQGDQIAHGHMIEFEMGTVIIAVSVAALSLAAFATLLLNLTSRRATLRQINASLLEISEQLKGLRQGGHT